MSSVPLLLINDSIERHRRTIEYLCDGVLFYYFCSSFRTDRPGHWTRPLLVIQRGLGLPILGGMAALLCRTGLQMGNAIDTSGPAGAAQTPLQGKEYMYMKRSKGSYFYRMI